MDALEPCYVNYNQLQPTTLQYEQELLKKHKQLQEKQLHPQTILQEGIFNDIVGPGDLKAVLMKCINSNEPVNVLLYGPPASAKTLFLLAINRELEKCYFIDGSNASGAGMIDYLFANKETKTLCIDELEKLDKRNQNCLLNLLETGILSSTKVRNTSQQRMNVKAFATSNDVNRISKPLRSRFLEFHLDTYTHEEFLEISIKLLAKRYGHNRELSEAIADAVWNTMKSKDLRNVITIGRLAVTNDDVHVLVGTLNKYRSGVATIS